MPDTQNPVANPPDTLPASFTGWDDQSKPAAPAQTPPAAPLPQAPDTLPANFSGWDKQQPAAATPVPLQPGERDAMLAQLKKWGISTRHDPNTMSDDQFKQEFDRVSATMQQPVRKFYSTNFSRDAGPLGQWFDNHVAAPIEKSWQEHADHPENFTGPAAAYNLPHALKELHEGSEKYVAPVVEAALNDPSLLAPGPAQTGRWTAAAMQYANMTDEDRKHVGDDIADTHPWMATFEKRYGQAAHTASKGIVDAATDPVNLALMVGSGGLADVAPLASFAMDTYFQGMMAKGTYDSSVHAGKALAAGDMDSFFGDLGSIPMQAYFASHGIDGIGEKIRTISMTHAVDTTAQETFGKPFTDLQLDEKHQVVQGVLKTLSSPKYVEFAQNLMAAEQAKDSGKIINAYQQLMAQEGPEVPDTLRDRADTLLQYNRARGLNTNMAEAPPHLVNLYQALGEGSLARRISDEAARDVQEGQLTPPPSAIETAADQQTQNLLAERRRADVNQAVQDMLAGKTPVVYDDEVRARVERATEQSKQSLDARLKLENDKGTAQSGIAQAKIEADAAREKAAGAGLTPPPMADEIERLRERIEQEADKQGVEGVRDLGRRQGGPEGTPALLPSPAFQAPPVPFLGGSPLTPEQKFAEAESEAWKLVHEGRAQDALQLLAQYDEYLREQPDARAQRFQDQTRGEMQRLADASLAEEERLTGERGFRDVGRKQGDFEKSPQVIESPLAEGGAVEHLSSKNGFRFEGRALEDIGKHLDLDWNSVGPLGSYEIRVLNSAGEEVGHVLIGLGADGKASISDSVINEEYRRQGLGKEAYEQAIKIAQKYGATEIHSGVLGTSDKAAAVWRSLGKKYDLRDLSSEGKNKFLIKLKEDVGTTPPPLQEPGAERTLTPPLAPTEAPKTEPAKKATFETPGTVTTLPHKISGEGEAGGTATATRQGIPVAWGNRGTVVTPNNRRVEFQYAMVPAQAVVTSFDSAFNVNPDIPAGWQPRERGRAASQDQFNSMLTPGEGQLDAHRMAESPNAGDGAPIVTLVKNPDGTTTIKAITRHMGATVAKTAYERESPIAAQFKQDTIDSASKFGLADANIDHPMLVRFLKTDMSDAQIASFAQEANVSTTARMGAVETAKVDAQKLTPEVIGLLQPTDDGSLNNVANADFVRAFVDSVASPSERGALMTKEGQVSVEGLARIRNALFAKAYPGASEITEMALESPDINIKNVKNAMDAAAPRFAQMQDMIDRDVLYDLGITEDIGDAAKKLSELRKTGRSVEDYLGQINLPGASDMSDAARELLRAINEKGRSVKGLTQILSQYADVVMDRGRKDQIGMFGAPGTPEISKESVLRSVVGNNSLIDFGDEAPAPLPEPAPASNKLTPPPAAEKLTPPPSATHIEFPASREIQPNAADVDRHKEMLKGLNAKKVAQEVVAAKRDERHMVDQYDRIRDGGIGAVLNTFDGSELRGMLEGDENVAEMSDSELESYIRENQDEIIHGLLTNLQDSIFETRARERAASGLSGKTAGELEPPPAVEPQTVQVEAARPNLDVEKQPEQFKAKNKGGVASIVVTADGREVVASDYSKEFTKKNRDKLIARTGSSSEPMMLVDENGNVLAQSAAWNMRQESKSPAETLQAMPDTDLKAKMDAARGSLAEAKPGSAMHNDMASYASRLEDELKRRTDLEAQPTGFGSRNTIVTEDEKDEIIRRLTSGQLQSGLPIDDIAKLGMYYFEAGAREIGAWTQQMVKALGEVVRPYLDEAWKRMPDVAKTVAETKLATADDATREKINSELDAVDKKPEVLNGADTARPVGTANDVGVQNQGRGTTPPDLAAPAKPEVQPAKPAARPVRPGDGTGTAPRRSPVAIQLDAPARVRGQWVVDVDKWKAELRANGLPESAPGPTVTLSPDVDKMLVYRPQKPIVEMALSELEHGSGSFVVGASTGTGKSYVGAAIIKETLDRNPGQQFVAFLTKNQDLVRDMKNTLAEFGIEGMEFPSGVSAPPEPGVYVTTYATLRNRPGMENFPWNLSVYDEASEMRNWQSSQQGAKGRVMGRSSEKNLYLSATPFSNAIDLGYLDSLGLWSKQGFETFARQFGVTVDKQTGMLAGGNAPLKLAAFREQLIQRGQFVNLDTDLTGHKFSVGIAPLEESQWNDLRNIDSAFNSAEKYFTQRGQTGLLMATKAGRVNFMKAYLERTRLPQAIELMKKLDAAGHKVVVFSETMAERQQIYDFLKEADANLGGKLSSLLPPLPSVYDELHKAFGDDIVNLSGGGSKAQEISDFNTNAAKHIYATYSKGGMGVSLHDTGGESPRAAIYLGPPWSGMLFQQGLGRIWRYGTKSDAYSIILGSDSRAEYNTITQRVLSRLESMKALVSGVDKESPTIKSMRSIEDAADYANGNEDPELVSEFAQRADASGIANYKDIQIPNAENAKNKGLNIERRDLAPPPGVAGAGTLYSGFDPIRAAKAAADLARSVARLGTKIKGAFTRGNDGFEPPPDPGDPDQTAIDMTVGTPSARRLSTEAFEDEEPGTKEAFANTVEATAKSAANGVAGDPTPAVVSAWRRAIDMLRSGAVTTGNAAGAVKDFMLLNGRQLISQRGGDIGKKIAEDMIPDYQIQQGNIAGPWLNRAQDIVDKHKLSMAEWSNLHLAVEGLAQPQNDRIAAAVPEVRQVKADMAKALRDAHVTTEIIDRATGQRRYSLIQDDPNYMQRIYPPEIFKQGAARDRVVKQIMEKYNVNLNDAERKLDGLKRDVPLAGTVERPREGDMPGYRTDFPAFLEGIEQTAEVIARTNVFGQRREKVSGLISMVPEADDRQVIDNTLDLLLKRNPWAEGPRDLVHAYSTWVVLSKMATSTIPMMSHWLKPVLETSMTDYARGWVKTMFDYKNAERAAVDAGALMRQTKMDWYRELGVQPGIGTKFLNAVGAGWVDKVGRVLAVNSAQMYMDKSALPGLLKNPNDPFIRRVLDEHYHINDDMINKAIQDRAWTREALARGGKAIADRTMFTSDPTELPGAFRAQADSSAAQTSLALIRTSLMLKGYVLKNTYFFKDALLGEAAKGNFRPLLPFVTLFPAMGAALMALRTAARGDKDKLKDLLNTSSYGPTKALKVYAEGIGFYTAANSASAMVDAIDRHSLVNWAVGPAINDTLNTATTAVNTLSSLIGGSPSKTVPDRFEWAGERWREYFRSTFVPIHPFLSAPPKHPPIRESESASSEPY